jgi:excisionase family DNA binding protein
MFLERRFAMLNLLSLEEAAKEMKVSIFTVRSWQYQKRFPIVKLGRRVLVKREDLESFVNKNVVEAK